MQTIIVKKEKHAVFPDWNWAADGSPEDVFLKDWGLIRFVLGKLAELIEILVRGGCGVAMVPVSGTVEGIGAALGHHGYLARAGASLGCVIVGRGDAELLERLRRNADAGFVSSRLVLRVVYIHSV